MIKKEKILFHISYFNFFYFLSWETSQILFAVLKRNDFFTLNAFCFWCPFIWICKKMKNPFVSKLKGICFLTSAPVLTFYLKYSKFHNYMQKLYHILIIFSTSRKSENLGVHKVFQDFWKSRFLYLMLAPPELKSL